METNTAFRPLHRIAAEIRSDWKKVNFAAKPYLDAMFSLDSVRDYYMLDSGSNIVRYFLCNSGTWKGETARRVKAELKKVVGLK